MIEPIKNKLLQIRRAWGLEISFLAAGEMLIQVVAVRLRNGQIIKEKEVHSVDCIANLEKVIPIGAPLAVTISGKGVLHKKIPPGEGTDKVFETILPNGNPGDFYMQISPYEHFSSACLIRRSQLDGVVDQLLHKRYKVLGLSLGVADLRYLLPYLNPDGDTGEIRTNHFLVRLDGQKMVTDIGPAAFPVGETRPVLEYSIGNQYVYSRGLIAFGSALGLLAGSAYGDEGILQDKVIGQGTEYCYFRYFGAACWSLLGGLFVALLISFLFYSHYARLNEEVSARLLLSGTQAQRTKQLESGLATREKFVRRYGWDHPSRISLYADRIAGLVPEEAVLTILKIDPVTTGWGGDNGWMNFQQDTIQVSGTCDDPTELNRFVNNLRNIHDFQQISIKSYSYKKELQTGIFFMEIITL